MAWRVGVGEQIWVGGFRARQERLAGMPQTAAVGLGRGRHGLLRDDFDGFIVEAGEGGKGGAKIMRIAKRMGERGCACIAKLRPAVANGSNPIRVNGIRRVGETIWPSCCALQPENSRQAQPPKTTGI